MDALLRSNPADAATEVLILLGCGVPLGIGVVALGVGWLVGSLRIAITGARTVGHVVRVDTSFGGEPGGTLYTPIVRFTEGREGREIEVGHTLGYNHLPGRYRVGRAVQVLYLPDRPEAARIRSFGGMWGGAVATIVAGLATCAIVVALFLHDVW